MNRDEIIRMAEAAGFPARRAFSDLSDLYPRLERFAALIEQHLSYDGIHTCHAECQRPACVAVRKAVQAERDRCILILERLHEQVGDQHNYYAHAVKLLKGEI